MRSHEWPRSIWNLIRAFGNDTCLVSHWPLALWTSSTPEGFFHFKCNFCMSLGPAANTLSRQGVNWDPQIWCAHLSWVMMWEKSKKFPLWKVDGTGLEVKPFLLNEYVTAHTIRTERSQPLAWKDSWHLARNLAHWWDSLPCWLTQHCYGQASKGGCDSEGTWPWPLRHRAPPR